MLANFKWWRKFKGGLWWHVRLKNMWDEPTYWINEKPDGREESFWFEDYTNTTLRSNKDDHIFYDKVMNAIANGKWRDKANLIAVAIRAKQLREIGVPDDIIIGTLAAALYAGKEEFILRDYAPIVVDIEELMNALNY